MSHMLSARFSRVGFTLQPLLFSRNINITRILLNPNNQFKSKVSDALKNAKLKNPLPSQLLAKVKPIKDNIYTIPNFLTLTRLVTAPVVGYFILHSQPLHALSFFTYSCITDFLDGFIARRYNLKSILGSIMDPMADKLLMTICTVTLSITSAIPTYLAVLIVGRDICLSIAAFIVRYVSLPKPKTLARYLDMKIPSVSVHPTMISKINTGLQMVYLGGWMVQPLIGIYGGDLTGILGWFEYVVAATTVWSGASYLFGKGAIKFIGRN
ncbi:cardiolipin synthase [Martiniozyma asiatica (nom. inval.)]|nr:cardiolipin synthase [Martiniozyma asiatica]